MILTRSAVVLEQLFNSCGAASPFNSAAEKCHCNRRSPWKPFLLQQMVTLLDSGKSGPMQIDLLGMSMAVSLLFGQMTLKSIAAQLHCTRLRQLEAPSASSGSLNKGQKSILLMCMGAVLFLSLPCSGTQTWCPCCIHLEHQPTGAVAHALTHTRAKSASRC